MITLNARLTETQPVIECFIALKQNNSYKDAEVDDYYKLLFPGLKLPLLDDINHQ